MQSDPILLGKPVKITGRVEIVRSFSYKLNMELHGGAKYESRDFFCSQKAECPSEEAGEASELLYEFCKAEVLSSVKAYLRDMEAQRARKDPGSERRVA